MGVKGLTASQNITADRAADAKRRLKAIEGQVRGLQRMIDEDRYCVDILVQVAAVQEALNQVGKIITRNYLECCVTNAIRSEDSASIYDELMDIIYKFRR